MMAHLKPQEWAWPAYKRSILKQEKFSNASPISSFNKISLFKKVQNHQHLDWRVDDIISRDAKTLRFITHLECALIAKKIGKWWVIRDLYLFRGHNRHKPLILLDSNA
jgi:hypothetical protein